MLSPHSKIWGVPGWWREVILDKARRKCVNKRAKLIVDFSLQAYTRTVPKAWNKMSRSLKANPQNAKMRLIQYHNLAIQRLILQTRWCVSSKWSGPKRMPTVKACYRQSPTPNSTKRWEAQASTSTFHSSWTPRRCQWSASLPKWASLKRCKRR